MDFEKAARIQFTRTDSNSHKTIKNIYKRNKPTAQIQAATVFVVLLFWTRALSDLNC